jgi:hypothetical protein
MLSQELLPLLHSFAVRNKNATIDLRQFLATPQAVKLAPADVEAAVSELAKQGACVVSGEMGKSLKITLPDFPLVALSEEYRQITVEAWKPFPKEDTLPIPIPAQEIMNVDVKSQFSTLVAGAGKGGKGAVKLLFPEGIDPLVVPMGFVATELVEAAAAKISHYLQNEKNASYVEGKLTSLLKAGDTALRHMVEDAAQRPKKAAATILSPNDYSFRFWTHMANLILQDLGKKKEKTPEDHGTCQSALIIGYMVFYQKGVSQKELERDADRKSLEGLVRKPPYVYGFEDLYDLKDAKGVTFVAKHSRDFIVSFLSEKTKRVGEESLPFLIRVHAKAQNKDYFIQRDLLVPVFLKKLAEASEELRVRYIDEWVAELRRDSTPAVSRNAAAFRRDVEIRVKEGYPLLAAMCNGAVLYLAAEESNVSDASREEMRRCFSVENILRPLDELLGLSRMKLLKDARSYLPFWQTMPILSQILRFFRRIFAGGGREKAGDAEPGRRQPANGPADVEAAASGSAAAKSGSNRENLLRYRRAIQSLVSQYVPAGRTIDGTLAELTEKWNPLLAADQKRNLVQDVNALVRDFLRPIRRSFLVRPPDLKRIHALAEQLSASKSLEKIKKKDPLKRYLELYMIRCLELKKM